MELLEIFVFGGVVLVNLEIVKNLRIRNQDISLEVEKLNASYPGQRQQTNIKTLYHRMLFNAVGIYMSFVLIAIYLARFISLPFE